MTLRTSRTILAATAAFALSTAALHAEMADDELVINGDTLIARAGTAVIFGQCWHSGLSNEANEGDRCVFYIQ